MRLLPMLLILFLVGCATQGPIGNPEYPYPTGDVAVGDLIHLATGHKINPNEMLEAIGKTRVIFIGETHDNPASHRLQIDVLRGLYTKNPEHLALAMEMFTPGQQPALDRWSAGELTEKEFLRQVGWFVNWQMNFGFYRPLLNFCRDNRIPVVALNAPKSLIRQVGRTPLAELPTEVREQQPEFDFSDPYQRAMTESIYSGHSKGKSMSDGFIRVQTLWDETMANNLAEYLKSPAGTGRQVVVVAGGNHVRYGFGIPRRLHRRLPVSYLLIGSHEIEIPEERQAQLMDVKMPQFPMRAWDYLKLTRYEKIDVGVKLGTAIVEDPQGILIKMVMPASVAEKAGLLKGDILIEADGVELKKRFDLLYLLMNRRKGESLKLDVTRGDERISVTAKF